VSEQFRNRKFQKAKISPVIGIITVIFVVLLFIAYSRGSLGRLGICPPGLKLRYPNSYAQSCYRPSGTEGKECRSKKECNGGWCEFSHYDDEGLAVGNCTDLILGCNRWIDNYGYAAISFICAD